MHPDPATFLPISADDLRRRGWTEIDILLVTGDAYVDHPSYGAAVIGRLLESRGYRVGIIAQPDWRSLGDFTVLGRPRLFAGITSGNVDSMVANHTAAGKPRQCLAKGGFADGAFRRSRRGQAARAARTTPVG